MRFQEKIAMRTRENTLTSGDHGLAVVVVTVHGPAYGQFVVLLLHHII